MRALLDVNVLIALFDAAHVHHRIARDWLHEHIAAGWASCPLTQNGCIRIMTQANYPATLKHRHLLQCVWLRLVRPNGMSFGPIASACSKEDCWIGSKFSVPGS